MRDSNDKIVEPCGLFWATSILRPERVHFQTTDFNREKFLIYAVIG